MQMDGQLEEAQEVVGKSFHFMGRWIEFCLLQICISKSSPLSPVSQNVTIFRSMDF